MSDLKGRVMPRPLAATPLPKLDAVELVAVDNRRLALRHWRDKQRDLARLEREPTTLRHVLSVARSAEIKAAEHARETGRALDEVLMGDG